MKRKKNKNSEIDLTVLAQYNSARGQYPDDSNDSQGEQQISKLYTSVIMG